jgi:hypothetical protein
MWEICFGVGRQRYCIRIPILIWQWPFEPPDPGPLRKSLEHWVEVYGPDPNPWRVDLVVLATTAAVAELSVDEGVRDALRSVAREQTDRLIKARLPQGVSISFGQ